MIDKNQIVDKYETPAQQLERQKAEYREMAESVGWWIGIRKYEARYKQTQFATPPQSLNG